MKVIVTIALLVPMLVFGQDLLPSIGLFSLPADSDVICDFPISIDVDGTFNTPGPAVGDTMPDFTLYDLAGNPVTLSTELQNGKYVLLIAGNYTCPAFRNKISKINGIVTNYPADVSVFVIYGLEAHPSTDTSIYFGEVQPGAENISSGIMYPQPQTYGERKLMVEELNDSMTVYAPILIDGPCNEFLDYFGAAPNNAYLIDTNGILVVKHGWFDKYPIDMSDDIDSVLNIAGSPPNGTNGTFSFEMISDTIDVGTAGEVLYVEGNFTNTHPTDDVIIQIQRTENNMPDGSWTSSMCINACLASGVNNYVLQLPPGVVQHFTFYFFTGSVANGNAEIVFTNTVDVSNSYMNHFYGLTDGSLEIQNQIEQNELLIYPNPTTDCLNLNLGSSTPESLVIIDVYGRVVFDDEILETGNQNIEINVSEWASGIYFINLIFEGRQDVYKFVVE